MRLNIELLSPDFRKQMDAEAQKVAHAATMAVTQAAAAIKSETRSQVSGFSRRLGNAAFARVYPGQGDSLHPAAVVGLKFKFASTFEEGTTIHGKPLMWLPLDNAPLGRGGKRMTPAQFVRDIGPLFSIERPGKPPLLGAVVRETDARSRKAPSLRLFKRGRNPGGRGTVRIVPVFVGVAQVVDPKKYDVSGIIRKYADQLPEFYESNWETLNRA